MAAVDHAAHGMNLREALTEDERIDLIVDGGGTPVGLT
jgi:hypothetical protein